MSSKFRGSRIRFKTPAVCKKTEPPETLFTYPPEQLQAWYAYQGLDGSGTITQINHSFNLQLIEPSVPRYRATFAADGIEIQYTIEQVSSGPNWRADVEGFRGFNFAILQENQPFTPRHLQPFNSNIFPLVNALASGNSQSRALL